MMDQFSLRDPKTQTHADDEFKAGLEAYFATSIGSNNDRLRNFAKYVYRQDLAALLAKNEIFKRVVNVHGHVIECGVFLGGGTMTWAQLSAIYEPINHNRRVIGFDTFTGFPSISERDGASGLEFEVTGGLATAAEADVRESIRLFDLNRPLGHIGRVELVVGDAMETIPRFLQDNQHVVVALLYLDFDIFEPTKLALESFLPRMPRGSVIAFDELNQKYWPGETVAVLETVGIRNLRIERFPFTPQLSFAVLD